MDKNRTKVHAECMFTSPGQLKVQELKNEQKPDKSTKKQTFKHVWQNHKADLRPFNLTSH